MSLLSNSEKTPSWQLTQLLQNFLQSESRSGFILIICTLISLVLANSALGASYTHLWHEPLIGSYSAEHLINDGLMTLFFSDGRT
jgi:NhaA family Na+:H+ antiporter